MLKPVAYFVGKYVLHQRWPNNAPACGEGQTRVREVPVPRRLSFSGKRHRDDMVTAAP
jgi:hypothetical protein